MQQQRGFTLIEILLSVALTTVIMLTVAGAFHATISAREVVNSLQDSTEAGPRILALLERDLNALWHHNLKGNKVLIGRNMDIAGTDSDRIDFVSTTDMVGSVTDSFGQAKRPSFGEVGYWLKENKEIPGLLELWRREDALVDDNLLTGGTFQLVHDRMRSFNITYFETLGHDAEAIHDWDSSRSDALPRRIKIEFTLERKVADTNAVDTHEVSDFEGTNKKYVREIVFDRRYPDILKAGIAMVPVAPPRPEAGQGGGGGPQGGGGAGGKEGAGAGAGAGAGRNRTTQGGFGAGQGGMPGRGGEQRGGGQQPPRNPGGNINLGDLLRGAGGGGGGGGLFGGGGRK